MVPYSRFVLLDEIGETEELDRTDSIDRRSYAVVVRWECRKTHGGGEFESSGIEHVV